MKQVMKRDNYDKLVIFFFLFKEFHSLKTHVDSMSLPVGHTTGEILFKKRKKNKHIMHFDYFFKRGFLVTTRFQR